MSSCAISVSAASRLDGLEAVLSWRADALLRAGFDSYGALDLALADHVDLHVAVRLVARGCPPQTARRILL
jgi:hypothetical protein